LRATDTLLSFLEKSIYLLVALLFINPTQQCEIQCLLFGVRRPFPPAVTIVVMGAHISTAHIYRRNITHFLQKHGLNYSLVQKLEVMSGNARINVVIPYLE